MKVTIKKQIIFLFFMLLIPIWAVAQVMTVKGTVKDDKSEALVGVSILEAGSTTNGTITDVNGNFVIKVARNAKLNISYIGYNKTVVNVNGRSVINIELKEQSRSLNEVVVVGYGNMRRTDLTGAVTSVSSEAIDKSVVTSVDQILQGRAAGVQVQQNSGQPGASSSIRIRGINSVSGSNEPVYVVDGVIIDGNSGSDTSNSLSSINPSDILSMDILKDASATAIYGSRGANGVIMITTKHGKSGEAKVSYNGYVGLQEMPKKLDMLNLQQYAYLKNARSAASIVQPDNSFVRPDLLGAGTDWQDELFSKALMTSHNLSITGGSDKSTYAFGAGYLNQDGIATGSGFERFTLRANIDTQVKKWLKSGVNLALSNSTQKLTVSDESLIKTALRQIPSVAARNADGTFDGPQTTDFVVTNPLGMALLKENYNEKTAIRGNIYLEATILKGLTYKTELSFNFGMDNTYKFSPSYTFGALVNNVIESERSKSYSKYWVLRNLINYNTTFAKVHSVNLMLGQEAQKSGWEYLDGYRSGFVSNVAHDLNMGDATTAKNQGSSYSNTLSSYFGRLFYSYDDRYLLTTTMRYDGSSQLAEGHRWAWFPSAALAWKVSNESFMKEIPAVYNLKLRLGWGLVGNQNVPNYAYTSLLTSVQTANWGTGLLSGNTANPNLAWETTSSSNIGIDLGLFKNKIELTADVYYKRTNNLLLQLPLPAYVGTTGMGSTSAPWGNVGSIENKGIELALNTVNVEKKNFSWKSTFVFSLNRNKVLQLNSETGVINAIISEGSETNIVTRTEVGQPIAQFYGYKVIGRFEKATDFYYKDANGVIKPTALPTGMAIGKNGVWIGDYIFQDVNKDGVIDDQDRTYIGNPEPKFTYGIGNTFAYKNWDLTIFLTGSYGNKVVNYQRRWFENPATSNNVLYEATQYAVLSKIDPAGPDDYRNIYISGGDPYMPRMAASSASSTSNFRYSDRFVEDGSYLRIQNVSLGYSLPHAWTKMLKIENLKIYANLQNLYTFSVYKGYDPEIGSMNQNVLLTGIDNARYPSPRIYTFGLNLTF